jgi:hypothetical protein
MNYLLFTIKTMIVDPVCELEKVRWLARPNRVMSPKVRVTTKGLL